MTLTLLPPGSAELLPTMQLKTPQLRAYAFNIDATVPPPTDPDTIVQRAEEVDALQQMLMNPDTSAILLSGNASSGRSMLAALLYHRLQLAAQSGLPAPHHFVWLKLGRHTTLPDVIAAILSRINKHTDPMVFFLKPEQQIESLAQALRRPQEQTLIVLDAFEELFDHQTFQCLADRGAISLFLDMLQTDLGSSRILLTDYRSPYVAQNLVDSRSRVRPYLVSRIGIPEGMTLLQQHGIVGSYDELALVWQRCGGHAFALVLFSALVKLTRFSLNYLLDSSDYQFLWSDKVTFHLLATVYLYLNSIQYTLMRTLSLFSEPVPTTGIFTVISGENPDADLSSLKQELATLTELALVQEVLNKRDEPCYTLHPLVRQYVIEHYLEGSEPQQTAIYVTSLGVTDLKSPAKPNDTETQEIAVAAGYMQVATYYRQLARKHCPPPSKWNGPQDIEFLLSTIRYLCLGWQWQAAFDLLIDTGVYESMLQWGAWNTLICLCKTMLPPSAVIAPQSEALLYSQLGVLYSCVGDYQQCLAHYEQALTLQRKMGDLKGEATTLTNRGEMFRTLNKWQPASANFEQALLLNKQLRDAQLENVLLHNLGLLYHATKDYPQALRYYRDALSVTYTTAEHYNEDMLLTHIAMLLYEQGYHIEALAVLLYTLQLRRSLQYQTISFIESFLDTFEQHMGPEAFAQMRQTAQGIQDQVIAQLLEVNE